MALPELIEKSDQEWLFKLTKKQSKWPERDLCLLAFFLGSPCEILELNKITISDVLNGDMIKKSFTIRGDKASNGEYRIMHIKQDIATLLKKYIKSMDNVYKNEFLFRTLKGEPFAITTIKGRERADSLKRHILDLLREGGIENPGSQSGRRTFATAAHRKGEHISTIHWLLGNKMLATTKRLINSDPLTMGEVSKGAF